MQYKSQKSLDKLALKISTYNYIYMYKNNLCSNMQQNNVKQ